MNKILISIIIGITTIFGIAIFLYIKIKYPDYFNILNGLFTLIASLATIFAACFAVITMQDFKKQKRAELLSETSTSILNNKDEFLITVMKLYSGINTVIEYHDKTNLSIFFDTMRKEYSSLIKYYKNFGILIQISDIKDKQDFTTLINIINDFIKTLDNLQKLIQEKAFTNDQKEKINNHNSKLLQDFKIQYNQVISILNKNSLYL
ncbi:hypothetical protein CIN_06020 [Commensalibacter intestini A911]|uniref:Uncharacterized protein n=1 Tax=Commensalibacter intestini A911 TaxID=1088868 RepID=G6EYT2_9PROT|nr:hypothetical protein [Commensalibacter intestini]EHD14670.1 hypothetical protein CIN_06020 [Commensalibacter intestini A911]